MNATSPTPDRGREDSRQIDAVMQSHGGPLLRYAARLLGRHEAARDVVQEAFARLWKQTRGDLSKLDSSPAAWLFVVARRCALDQRRKDRRMTLTSQPPEQIDLSPAPDARMSMHDDTARVTAALRTLTERQQEAIRLKFDGGLTYRQIAQVMGISESNVGFLISTGLKTVREQLGQ